MTAMSLSMQGLLPGILLHCFISISMMNFNSTSRPFFSCLLYGPFADLYYCCTLRIKSFIDGQCSVYWEYQIDSTILIEAMSKSKIGIINL